MTKKAGTWLLCGLFLLLSAAAAQADKRVALVVGNSAYQNAPMLPNPARDARAMAALFQKAGFDVVSAQYDVGNLDFKRAIRQFEDKASDSDIAVVYFAGHGIEIHGTNYLIPVDARLASDRDADDEAITLDRLLESVSGAKRLRLVILDACRDNPFAHKMMQQRTAALRGVNSGLATVEPDGINTLIAYAAKQGSAAEDGSAGHSPFTAALLNDLFVPGLDVRLAFGRVRDDVLKQTGHQQEPFVYGSLGGANIALVPSPNQQSGPTADPEGQRNDYTRVEKIDTKGAWESFIAQYPTGFYSDLARERLASLDHSRAQAEKDRQAAAQVEQDRLARQQAEADKATAEAKAKVEADKATAEAKAKADAAANKDKVALATPPAVPAPPKPPDVLAGGALVEAIKTELKRVGCYSGAIDDNWSNAETKSSVGKFVKFADLAAVPDHPGTDFLNAIRQKAKRVCPLECGAGERPSAEGACVDIPKAKSANSAPHAHGSGKRCFVYGGQPFCE